MLGARVLSETAFDAVIDAEETLLEEMKSNRRYSAGL
jgi:hypothetical protein